MTLFDEVQDLQNPSMVLDTLFCEEEDFEDEFEEKEEEEESKNCDNGCEKNDLSLDESLMEVSVFFSLSFLIQDFWGINIIYCNNNEIEPFNTVEYHLNVLKFIEVHI
ncbi:hypothetical protein CsatB_026219 [Cannabis sativa]